MSDFTFCYVDNAQLIDFKNPHALKRQQQRCISDQIIDLLYDFGKRIYDHHGGEIYFFDKKCLEKIKKYYSYLYKICYENRRVYFVEKDGKIVTVAHAYKKIFKK